MVFSSPRSRDCGLSHEAIVVPSGLVHTEPRAGGSPTLLGPRLQICRWEACLSGDQAVLTPAACPSLVSGYRLRQGPV